MLIKKIKVQTENYREFEESRLVYEGDVPSAPNAAEDAEAADREPDATETPDADRNVSAEIQGRHQEVIDEIDRIRGLYEDGHEHHEAAQQFANELTEHTNGAFNFLQNEYKTKRAQLEEGNPEEDERIVQIHAQAEQLKEDILSRLEEHETIVAERAEKARKRPQFEEAQTNLTNIVAELNDDITKEMLQQPQCQEALSTFIEDLTDTRFNQLVGGEGLEEFELTETERQSLITAFEGAYGYENLEGSDNREVGLINGLRVKGRRFPGLFGEDMANILSMNCEIKEEDGKVMIRANDSEGDFVEATPEALTQYLPEEMRAGYTAVLEGGFTRENQEQIVALQNAASAEKLTMENAQQIQELLANPEKVEGLKKMGLFELIATITQLWGMLQEAMETRDFTSLNDALTDLQSGKSPLERMESVKEKYETAIAEIDDVGQLLDLYHNPYGETAGELFVNKGEDRTPYRIYLKEIIRTRLASALGVGIDPDGVEQLPGGAQTKITAIRGEAKYSIIIEGNNVTMHQLDEDNNPIPVAEGDEIVNKPFNGLYNQNPDCLSSILFNRMAPPPAETEEAVSEEDEPVAEDEPLEEDAEAAEPVEGEAPEDAAGPEPVVKPEPEPEAGRDRVIIPGTDQDE